jgi:hypothetical protein
MDHTGTIYITVVENNLRIIPLKFGQNPSSGLGGDFVSINCGH